MKNIAIIFISSFVLALMSCSDSRKPDNNIKDKPPISKEQSLPTKQVIKPQKNKERTGDSPSNDDSDDSREFYKQVLQKEIEDVNHKLPHVVESGITVTLFIIEGNNAVYYYMCDEPAIDMDAVKSSKSQIKEASEKSLKTTKDPETIHLLKLLKDAEMGLVFRHQGISSGKTVDISFSPSEINSMRS